MIDRMIAKLHADQAGTDRMIDRMIAKHHADQAGEDRMIDRMIAKDHADQEQQQFPSLLLHQGFEGILSLCLVSFR